MCACIFEVVLEREEDLFTRFLLLFPAASLWTVLVEGFSSEQSAGKLKRLSVYCPGSSTIAGDSVLKGEKTF